MAGNNNTRKWFYYSPSANMNSTVVKKLTRVKPTQEKTMRHVQMFARTTSVTRNTAIRARAMLRKSSSEIT